MDENDLKMTMELFENLVRFYIVTDNNLHIRSNLERSDKISEVEMIKIRLAPSNYTQIITCR